MEKRHVKVYIYCLLHLIFVKLTYCECGLDLKKSLIPTGYEKNIVPPNPEGIPTPVYIFIQFTEIDYILEEKMEYSMNFYFHEFWKDSRLNFTCFGIREEIPRELFVDLWTPDIVFENMKEGQIPSLSVPNIIIWVSDYGYLNRITRFNLRGSCNMDLRIYPMDTQYCYLYISALANDDLKISLKWFHERKEKNGKVKDLIISNLNPLKYRLLSLTPGNYVQQWPNGNYTVLFANFTFERRLSSHVFNFYIPSGLVVLLSSLTFWFSYKSTSARLTVGLTSLLTLSTQAWQARSNLPDISYLTALDIWLFSCVIQVFLTMLAYMIIYNISRKKVCKKKFNRTFKILPKSKPNRILDWSYITKDVTSSTKVFEKRSPSNSTNNEKEYSDRSKAEAESMDRMCRYLFPIGFAIFATIYWLYYLVS